MAAVTIRNLSDETHRALKARAAKHSRSTEAEVRAILDAAVEAEPQVRLGSLLAGIYLTTITVAELRYGISALPDGRRKRGLDERFENEVLPLFAGRVLPFDEPSSAAYAQLQAKARTQGRPLPAMDALIAAICVANRHALATRNTAGFASTGLTLINPWHS